jgi:hypothetical protein
MNQEMIITILITLAAVVVLRAALVLVLSGGDFQRIRLTIRASWKTLTNPEFADRVRDLLGPKKEEEKPSGEPLRFLGLLQREGRLVDFFMEDIQAYANEQIGAAVRDIHASCRKSFLEHLTLVPILTQSEGSEVEIPTGFNPAEIRLTGNVTGQPPFKGHLRHHGWRVQGLKLAPLTSGQDPFILAPAEVELPEA